MPKLKSQRETFAKHVAAGMTFAKAARLAGYSTKWAGVYGSSLMRHPQVRGRVAELRQFIEVAAHVEQDDQNITIQIPLSAFHRAE